MSLSGPARPLCLFVALAALASGAAAQPDGGAAAGNGAGAVRGRVVDARSGTPLPGALAVIAETVIQDAAGRDGAFRLAGVPAGEQVLVVTYLGYQTVTSTVTVPPGATLPVDVVMSEVVRARGDGHGLRRVDRRRQDSCAQPAEDRPEHHQRRLRRPDRTVPGRQRRRGDPAHSRHHDRARPGRGALRLGARRRGPAQLDADRRRAHPVARGGRAGGGPRRHSDRPAPGHRGLQGPDPGHGRRRHRRRGEPGDEERPGDGHGAGLAGRRLQPPDGGRGPGPHQPHRRRPVRRRPGSA